eukprot:scaffold135143_cov75-Phaeocystis_antarctica.AAC.2
MCSHVSRKRPSSPVRVSAGLYSVLAESGTLRARCSAESGTLRARCSARRRTNADGAVGAIRNQSGCPVSEGCILGLARPSRPAQSPRCYVRCSSRQRPETRLAQAL